MAEYVVEGADPNETVLHSRTPNGYEVWNWLPVHERIVRCRDCMSVCEHYEGMDVWWCRYLQRYVGSNGFCFWGVRRAKP